MAEPEEKLLYDYFQQITSEAEQVPELKLDAAIRSGMQRGRRIPVSLRKGYAVVLFAVVAITLFYIVPWANQITHPVRAQLPPKSWGELEVYRPIIADNITMKSAIDAGFIKEIAVPSSEVDGVKFTVNGIVVDRIGIAVLYTIQNSTNQKMLPMGLSLKKASTDNNSLTGYSGFSTSNAKNLGSPGTTHMFQQIVWNNYQDEIPEMLNLTLKVIPSSADNSLSNRDIKSLHVEIPIDVDKNYFQGEVVELKKSISIAGQKIKMDNVYIGPTGIYMREIFDGGNTMKIFSVLSSKLIIGKGEDQAELMRASGTSFTNIYHNDNMRPDDPIKLEIEGITALDKSKVELVINTETQQILKAPDSNLTISKRMNDEEQGVLILDLFIPKKDKEPLAGSGFSLNDNFVDSTGSGHWMEPVKDGYSGYKEFKETSEGSIETYHFNIGKDKLPQPLTFNFTYYSNVIMESDSVRVR